MAFRFSTLRRKAPLPTANYQLPTNGYHLKTERGFTILEVLITAVIIGVITGIVVLRYGAFNNLILLKNQAYQIALDLRETQTRSLSAVGISSDFRQPYGVYFQTANSGRYIIFRDNNGNGLYNAGEELETRVLDSRFRLNRLCNASVCNLTTMSVVFRRPNFDAVINNGAVATEAALEVVTVDGSTTRRVTINAAGRISVE